MPTNDEVEVRLRFDGRWVAGFDVCDVQGEGPARKVRLRRRSDGVVLPEPFDAADVRPVDAPVSPTRPARAG